MNPSDIQFLIAIIGGFSLFVLSAGMGYCLIVADKAYSYYQRGYSLFESVVAAVGELQ